MWTGWLRIRSDCELFCRSHPAFFLGACLFAGVWIALSQSGHCVSRWFFCFALMPFMRPQRFFWAALLVCAAFFSTSSRVTTFSSPRSAQGTLVAEVIDRHIVTIHGKTLWRVDLFVHSFHTSTGHLFAKGVYVHTHIASPCPVRGGKLYSMKGTFFVDETLQPHFRSTWSTLVEKGNTFSFVEARVVLRSVLERIFASLFASQDERMVAGALAFGLYKDPNFQYLMHRAGVEHVLAISGFHFGVVAALTLLFVRGMRPHLRALIAMGLLTLYLLIVGPLPSVMRSWWAAMVALAGVLLGKKTSGLNCLGVGLIAAVILDPVSLSQVGCQLSFLATFSILLFSQHASQWSSFLIRQKSREQFVSFSLADQALTTILHRIFPALSLIVPVWAVIVPYQLAFMEEISLLGIIYNLCIPLLFSLAMPCILLAVLCYPIPLLAYLMAFIGLIPLRCGIFLVQAIPEGHWTVACGGTIYPLLASGIILSVFLGGCILESRSAHQEAEMWKACM